jgi:transcription antitermination factor NusG
MLQERIRRIIKRIFREVLVPSENVVELVKGEKKKHFTKIFPGLYPREHGSQ